jgi:uncharacterized membrane protein
MSEKKEDFELINYTLGIISIVLAFFQPLAAFIFGIIGFVKSKNSKTDISKKANKLNLIGIIVSIVMIILTIIATIYYNSTIAGLASFPSS